ncbi:MAG: type II 3-dehydroquinate dehydratase [Pseudomonadota bacterium]
MKPIFILNGPNLNLLGAREPEIYGSKTLADIEADCRARAGELGFKIEFRQTNSEGTLVDWVQAAGAEARALILNAGAYTHTSIALHDALKAIDILKLEVHLSNPAQREAFRHVSFVGSASRGAITGLGPAGYLAALEAVKRLEAEGLSG